MPLTCKSKSTMGVCPRFANVACLLPACFRLCAAQQLMPGPWRFQSLEVPSLVPAQPFGDAETRQGAVNRATGVSAAWLAAHGVLPQYSVGLEGGVGLEPRVEVLVAGGAAAAAPGDSEHVCFAWMVVAGHSVGPDGAVVTRWGCAKTGTFALPAAVSALLREGQELGHATDAVFHATNSKQLGG